MLQNGLTKRYFCERNSLQFQQSSEVSQNFGFISKFLLSESCGSFCFYWGTNTWPADGRAVAALKVCRHRLVAPGGHREMTTEAITLKKVL